MTHLAATDWTWFHWGVLRGAGFPVRHVEQLRSGVVCDAAHEVIARDYEVAQTARTLQQTLRAVVSASQRRRLARAVRARRPIAVSEPTVAQQITDWNACLHRRESSFESFLDASAREYVVSTRRLQAIFEDDALRRAVLWQNRSAVKDLTKARDSWDERTLLKYIARYSTKNDTIGFFGPVVWLTVADEPGFATFHSGPSLTLRTSLSFEVWPIARIAEQLAEHKDLRPWLSPRRSALCRVQGRHVFLPPSQPLVMSDEDVDLLLGCDGHRTARDITGGSAEAMRRLETLCEKGIITWTLDCPLHQHPERAIARVASRVEDEPVRARVESDIAWIHDTTASLVAAMDTAPALELALARADREFEQRYSTRSIRSAGQYYAGRTLTYIDCERDASLTLKSDLMRALMAGARPLLLALRWYTYTVAQRLVDGVGALVPIREHRPLASIFPSIMGLIWSTVRTVADEYRDKWRNLLSIDPTLRTVDFDADSLTAAISSAFSAPHPGWPLARVHNPDVLIASASADELARGHFSLILGEIHASLPSMFQAAIFWTAPDPDAMRHAFHAIVPRPPIVNEQSPRLDLGSFFGDAAQLWLPDEPVTHGHVKSIADFDVVHDTDGVRIGDVTTGDVWPLPAFFDIILSRSTFHIDPFDQPEATHWPRLRIGDVVVARERWRLAANEVGLRRSRPEDSRARSDHFLAVRRWAAANGVPRHVFARSPKEPKPLFLDLESQPSVAFLIHLLRQVSEGPTPDAVTVTEMIPAPQDCWLHDAADNRYTSEVRLLAIDPVPYPLTLPRPGGSEVL